MCGRPAGKDARKSKVPHRPCRVYGPHDLTLKLRRAADAAAPVYRPGTQVLFASDEEGGWIKDSDIRTEWTATGRPLREVIVTDADGEYYVQIIENKYDDRGLVVEQIVKEGETEQTAEPVSKLVRTYDERMPWVVTSNMNYAPDAAGGWAINHNANNYRNTVTRDAMRQCALCGACHRL